MRIMTGIFVVDLHGIVEFLISLEVKKRKRWIEKKAENGEHRVTKRCV